MLWKSPSAPTVLILETDVAGGALSALQAIFRLLLYHFEFNEPFRILRT